MSDATWQRMPEPNNPAGKGEQESNQLERRSTITIHCRGLVKGVADGEALVAPTTLSFWGEVDPVTGRVLTPDHPLAGQHLGGKVLVIASTKGSSATPLVIGLAKNQGNAPAAFLNTQIDALAVLGCVVNGIPMATDFDENPFAAIRTGDRVHVDTHRGLVVVTRKP